MFGIALLLRNGENEWRNGISILLIVSSGVGNTWVVISKWEREFFVQSIVGVIKEEWNTDAA